MKKSCSWKNASYGGQAVLDGVMMKSKDFISVSVRNENDEIVNETYKFNNFMSRHKFWRIPFIRGIANMAEMLATGMDALTRSVNMHIEEEEEKMSFWHMFFTIIVSVGIALALFKLLPLSVASLLTKWLNISSGFLFNLIDALFKIIILIAYILVISLMSDIKALFMYHGAEHKSVYCWEKFKDIKHLTVKNAKKFSTLHPRCGTSFLLFVVFFSLLIYMLIPFGTSFWVNYLYRLMLLPLIIAVSYEFLKLTAKNTDSFIMKILMQPGLLMQKLTTSEPTNPQLEVALDSLKHVIEKQKNYDER